MTVGFIDPGNWATNVAGGSSFGYSLLWVITMSTLMLILLQNMSARLGIVTGHSLAYNVRRRFSPGWTALMGGSIVVACIATDVAELLGGALGFKLLFGLPLIVGGTITVVLKIALIYTGRYRHIERVIVAFIAIVSLCYLLELALVHPAWGSAARGAFIPHLNLASIAIAIGMMGAVVMPHNLYLHSNVVLNRDLPSDEEGRHRLIAYEKGDTALAMGLGWLINCAMVVVAAAVFFRHGIVVTSLEQASATLQPLAGSLCPVPVRDRPPDGRARRQLHLLHGRGERSHRLPRTAREPAQHASIGSGSSSWPYRRWPWWRPASTRSRSSCTARWL